MLSIFALVTAVILSFTLNAKCDTCPDVIERARWGARPWKNLNYLVTPLLYVIIHHTLTQECNKFGECADMVKNIQNYHMEEKKLDDIGYSFLIGGDGSIYEGTGWLNEGSHTPGFDRKAVSIAFIGNFQKSFRNSTIALTINKDATEKSIKAAHDLVACGKSQRYLRQNVKVIAARQVYNTDSPGNKLYERIKNWPEWSEIL